MTASDLRDLTTQTIQALLSGDLKYQVASAVGNLIKVQSGILRDVDFENRLARIEQKVGRTVVSKRKTDTRERTGASIEPQAELTLGIKTDQLAEEDVENSGASLPVTQNADPIEADTHSGEQATGSGAQMKGNSEAFVRGTKLS
jgi:hypothetical protein